MDDITPLQECAVKTEEDEVNAPVDVLLQPKVEREEDAEEREAKPIAAVYLFPMEEEQLQDPLAMDPLAGCENQDEKKPLPSFLVRVKKEEAADREPDAEDDAGTPNERSEEAAFGKVKDQESGRNRAESSHREREASKRENDDVLTHTNRQPFACRHCSETFRHQKTLKEHERGHKDQPQLLTCDTCQRQFTTRRALVPHIRTHMNNSEKKINFPCQTCGKTFKCRRSYNVHLRIHTGEKPFICDHCGKRFTDKTYLYVHRRMHTGEQPYSCSICKQRFGYWSNLLEHTKNHLNIRPYECKECGKSFVQSIHLRQHLRIHTGERPYKCSICSKTFAHKGSLNGHMFTHNRDQKQISECEICGCSFKTTYMRLHMRTHTGEKPYKCNICSKAFALKGGFNNHMFTHNRERKHMSECEICGGSYKTTYMICHMRSHTGEKPYKCKFCDAMFAYTSSRLTHEQTHSNIKAFQCKECGKSFSLTKNLNSHMRCHTGKKPYKCRYCEKTFTYSSSWKGHEMTHTKAYSFNCAECGKGYSTKKNLVNHIRTHGSGKLNVKRKRRV